MSVIEVFVKSLLLLCGGVGGRLRLSERRRQFGSFHTVLYFLVYRHKRLRNEVCGLGPGRLVTLHLRFESLQLVRGNILGCVEASRLRRSTEVIGFRPLVREGKRSFL